MARTVKVLLVIWTMVALAAGAAAEPYNRLGQQIKREILALYDSEREGTADATRIHRFAELPLNHLGYMLRYQDVRQPLPPPQETTRFAGVLSWLVGPVGNGDAYLAWLEQVGSAGTRIVVLGEIGAIVTARNRRLANSVLSAFGLNHTGTAAAPADGSRVVLRDADMYEFECRLDPVLPDYPILERTSDDVRTIIELQSPAFAGGRRSTLVTIGPGGGFAAFNFEFCHQSAPLHRGKWLIDPFAFFHAALGQPRSPVPDTTTMSGRRLYFSIVHSEGWSAPVEAWGQRQQQQIAAQIAARDLIEAFPDLPVTLDLRDVDVSRSSRNAALARALADHVLALPHISQPGKHAVASKLTRRDASYDSISNLAPLAAGGNERVLLAAMSSERAYVSARAQSPLNLHSLRETLAGTERPRRLKPANINYHVSVATDRALLGILRQHIEAVRASRIAPVPASLYAEIADGFFNTRVESTGPNAWRIGDRGLLQTVRFDDAVGKSVDLSASRGVIGHTQHAGALYVALDETVDVVEVVLSDRTNNSELGLIDSRWRLRNVVRGSGSIAFEAIGHGPGEFNWRGASGATYDVTARRGTDALWHGHATADEQGRFSFTMPVSAIEPLSLQIAEAKR